MNCYTNTNQITTDGSNSFTHDDNGNNTANGNATYGYDVYDRLTSVSSTGFNANYKYDAFGNRREKTVNGTTQRFVLDILGLSKVLLETDASNNAQNYYIYGLDLISRIDASNTTHYYHDDFRGSIIALTDVNETITHKYQYADFGAITQIEEANYNPYRYVGKHGIQFEANGLYFMRARYYDAHTGRFLTEDPIWATNLYPYAGNNPVMNIDRTGGYAETPLDIASLAYNLEQFDAKPGFWNGVFIAGDIVTIIAPGFFAGGSFLRAGKFAVVQTFTKAKQWVSAFNFSKRTSQGFESFSTFKRSMGSAGKGNAWHHIVEQNPSNISKFGTYPIHNTDNLIILPHGKGSIHAKISGHYSSKQSYSNGMTIREWLNTKNFDFQYDYGIKKLSEYGWTP